MERFSFKNAFGVTFISKTQKLVGDLWVKIKCTFIAEFFLSFYDVIVCSNNSTLYLLQHHFTL